MVARWQLQEKFDLLELVEGQAKKEDEEEMMGVPEHLEVGTTDELKRRSDHQEESHGDDVASDTSSCHKTHSDGVLQGVSEHESREGVRVGGGKEREREREREQERERERDVYTYCIIVVHGFVYKVVER